MTTLAEKLALECGFKRTADGFSCTSGDVQRLYDLVNSEENRQLREQIEQSYILERKETLHDLGRVINVDPIILCLLSQ